MDYRKKYYKYKIKYLSLKGGGKCSDFLKKINNDILNRNDLNNSDKLKSIHALTVFINKKKEDDPECYKAVLLIEELLHDIQIDDNNKIQTIERISAGVNLSSINLTSIRRISPPKSLKQPTNQSTKQPTQQPTKESTQQPLKEQTQQPIKEPTKEPTQQPIKEPTQLPLKEPTKQQPKQPTQLPPKEPIKELTKQPPKESTKQPPKEPTKQSTKQPPKEPTKQSTKQPEPTKQSTIGRIKQTVIEQSELVKTSRIQEIHNKYKLPNFEVRCFTTGYKQHTGECWHDAILMFFSSQDEIKETIQRKLQFLTVEEIVELAILKGRDNLLPIGYKDKYLDNTDVDHILKKYLIEMKERFKYYYNYYNSKKPPLNVQNLNLFNEQSKRIALNSAQCGMYLSGLDVHNMFTVELLMIILSCILLDEKELTLKLVNTSEVKLSDLNNLIACLTNLDTDDPKVGHVTLLYDCNGISYHFDDNRPTPTEFDFKKIFYNRIINKKDISFNITRYNDKKNNNSDFIIYDDLFIPYKPYPTLQEIKDNDIYKLILKRLLLVKFTDGSANDSNYKINRYLEIECQLNKFGDEDANPINSPKIFHIFEYYLKKGANPNTIYSKYPFLYWAYVRDFYDVFEELLKNKADPNITIRDTPIIFFPTNFKNGEKYVELLIKYGANINLVNCDKDTPLHIAISFNKLNIIKLLLVNKADLTIKNNKGETPLDIAFIYNQIDNMIELIRNGANPNIQNDHGKTPLHLAINNNRIDFLKVLLENRANPDVQNNKKETPLHIATSYNKLDIIKLLLANKANPNLQNNKGETPLDIAFKYYQIDNMIELIKNGANPNIQNDNKETPLHLAIYNNRIDFLKVLLENKANPNVQNDKKEMPLHCAIMYDKYEFVKTLLEYNADPNITNKDQETALHLGIKYKSSNKVDLVTNLIKYRADPKLKDINGKTAYDLANMYDRSLRKLL